MTLGFLSEYVPDVSQNIRTDGFQWSDFLTISQDNILRYGVSSLTGLLTCIIGGLNLNIVVSSLSIALINTGAAYATGKINNAEQAFKYFAISCLISSLTVGVGRVTQKYIHPSIMHDIPTVLNKALNKVVFLFKKVFIFMAN